ncbi:hypothetical protein LINGRAHAP2_LOCUS9744 [Linum grandiflorum]
MGMVQYFAWSRTSSSRLALDGGEQYERLSFIG